MKKIILLAMVLSFCVACSSNVDVTELQDRVKDLERENAEMAAELLLYKGSNDLSDPVDGDLDGSKTNDIKPFAPGDDVVQVAFGETIEVEDFCEFIVKDFNINQRIDPPEPSSFYTYYETSEEGEKYVDVVIEFKSLLAENKAASDFADVVLMFNDKYEYKAFSTIEDKGGSDFTYTNITGIGPLKNGTIHYLTAVPQEVWEGTEPIVAKIKVNRNIYQVNIR